MADKPVYEVEGGRQLRQTLKQADEQLADLKRAHAEAAQIAAEASAQLAPRRSGKLAATIRSSGTKTAGIIRAGRKSVPYAAPIHWGWNTRPSARRGWRGGTIDANPFLSTGAKDSEGRWIRVYERHVAEALEKVKGA